jgi:hypothetical protein
MMIFNDPDITDIVHLADAFQAFESQVALAVEQKYPTYFEVDTVEKLVEKLGIIPSPNYRKMKISCRKVLSQRIWYNRSVPINKHCEVLDKEALQIVNQWIKAPILL